MLRVLKDACAEWRPAVDADVDPVAALNAVWTSVVGPDVAHNSRPLEIAGDTLVVATRSSAWSQQLSFLAEPIVAAIRRDAAVSGITKLRFRVGKLATRSAAPVVRRRTQRRFDLRTPRADAKTVGEALARYATDVAAARRAKAAAGWKECSRCGAHIARETERCARCENAESDRKFRAVARLLFEAPWLGYDALAQLVDGLSAEEYRHLRTRILQRWWELLDRARRAARLSGGGRERLVASSYVLLKSGLDPERVTPAIVRNVLGDELHGLIYGNTER
ncbi:MAG: DUF721 domain-containing protein [Candidatus Eremiobacteraeota bacterium]|nr:DUF721 domain-containing protein [Candidatus Eremiobacteraeota bacterium]